MQGPTRFLVLAACAPLAAVGLSSCDGNSPSPRAIYDGQFPPPLVEEAEGLVRQIATEHGLFVSVSSLQRHSRYDFFDGFESLALWILPNESTLHAIIILSRAGMSLGMYVNENPDFPGRRRI